MFVQHMDYMFVLGSAMTEEMPYNLRKAWDEVNR